MEYDHVSCLLQMATKWNLIGVGLKLPDGVLDDICEHHPIMLHGALEAVFTAWQKTNCSPYTWASILKVLASPDVEHKELADDIVSKLVTCTQISKWSKNTITNDKFI